MFDFNHKEIGEDGSSQATMTFEGGQYIVAFGTDHKNQSSGYYAQIQDGNRNLLISHITGTIAGYNYSNVWSAYK